MTEVRFFRNSAGQRIAFTDEGEGPLVLLPPWWVSHLERDAEDPAYARYFARLASRFRVIRYDRVGVGMSDRARREFTLDSELADFSALVEHVGEPRFHLLGCSCGGPVALAYAAHNPDRVERIVLFGSYLHGGSLSSEDIRTALVGLVRSGMLGSRTLADIFHPGADGGARRRFKSLQRASADAETAAQLLELSYALDARPYAAQVQVPVLVLHRQHDHAVAHEEARTLAAGLPDASLTTLPGSSHMPWHDDADAVVDAIVAFLASSGDAGRTASPDESLELRREGEVWRLRFEGRQALLRDSKGLADLERLLECPGESIHVLDLMGIGNAEQRDVQRGDVTLDRQALGALHQRLVDLDAALTEAETDADLGRRTGLSLERQALLDQLAADVGRGRSARRLNDPVERARKAVAARVRDAIRRVTGADRAAGEHLERSVQTGVQCVYRPRDPNDERSSQPRTGRL